MHTEVFLSYIQAYSGISSTLCNLCIFITLPYSKPWSLEPKAYIEKLVKLCSGIFKILSQSQQFIQALFSHIQTHPEPCVLLANMQKSDKFGILEHSEPFHNCILTHTQNFIIFMEIGKLCVTLEIQDHDILTVWEYSETLHFKT